MDLEGGYEFTTMIPGCYQPRDVKHLPGLPGPASKRPIKIHVDGEEVTYISELEDRFSIVDLHGNVIGRYGSERNSDPGRFWGLHGIWVDSEGSIYIAEWLNGARMQKFARRK